MRRIIGRIAFCVLAALILGTTPHAFSQSNNASIDGEITDPNGAIVPGASVVLTSKDTKQSSTFVSDPDGLYSFSKSLCWFPDRYAPQPTSHRSCPA